MLRTAITIFVILGGIISLGAKAKLNPMSHYFISGKTVAPWQWAVGNDKNYYIGLSPTLTGKTADGVLKVTQGQLDTGTNTLMANWNGKGEGSLFLSSNTIDLSAYEHKVAIVADYKIHYKPRRLNLSVALDCGYPCRGEIPIGKQFKNKPKGEWFTFPIPLNCFSAAGADLTKVSTVYQLHTAQKLSIEVNNVRLVLLPDNEPGCR